MAANRKGSGATINIATASAAVTSGLPCVQEGFFGIALGSAASGASFELALTGRWNIAVPASTAKGDLLYIPATAGIPTEDADVTAELTRTGSNANVPVVKAMSARDSDGLADVLILPQAAQKAGTQV